MKPREYDRELGVDQGQKMGGRTGTGTAADAGTRRRVHGRAAEADRRQVQITSRWAALFTNRGVGEQVKIERASKRNSYR